jgi:hypothetical protein
MLTPRRALTIAMIMAGFGLVPGLPASAAVVPSGSTSQIVSEVRHAWQISKGRGVTVAVLSDGVDPYVTGLAGRVTVGPDYVKFRNPDFLDGTLIAGGIVGDGPGTGGLATALGLAPEAEILSVRIEPNIAESGADNFYNNVWSSAMIADGIRYAVGHGAEVIYIDAVSPTSDTANLESTVQYALAKGVVITTMAAQALTSMSQLSYPAAIPGVIAAAMVTLPSPFQALLAGSYTKTATNESGLVAVPDNTVSETGPNGQPYSADGYDASPGWIAGTAALIKSAYPRLAPALVARAIALSARDHPKGGYNIKIGFGLINPYGALIEAGKLAKLSATASVAADGSARVSSAAYFGSLPKVIHRSTAKTAAFAGVLAVGVIVLLGAVGLALRRRRPTLVAPAPPRHAGPF